MIAAPMREPVIPSIYGAPKTAFIPPGDRYGDTIMSDGLIMFGGSYVRLPQWSRSVERTNNFTPEKMAHLKVQ